jgi:hypothetical protein
MCESKGKAILDKGRHAAGGEGEGAGENVKQAFTVFQGAGIGCGQQKKREIDVDCANNFL